MEIWKFAAPITDELTILMPKGAKTLAVQIVDGNSEPQIWALVDPAQPKHARRFAWRGTGHDAGGLQPHMFVGTVQSGPLIFHLFDRDRF